MTLAGTCRTTSEIVHQVCLASSTTMATIPCSSFLSERATLRIGHSAPGCNDHKANATLTVMSLRDNKIEDRGAVALAAAVKALLVTVYLGSSTESVPTRLAR